MASRCRPAVHGRRRPGRAVRGRSATSMPAPSPQMPDDLQEGMNGGHRDQQGADDGRRLACPRRSITQADYDSGAGRPERPAAGGPHAQAAGDPTGLAARRCRVSQPRVQPGDVTTRRRRTRWSASRSRSAGHHRLDDRLRAHVVDECHHGSSRRRCCRSRRPGPSSCPTASGSRPGEPVIGDDGPWPITATASGRAFDRQLDRERSSDQVQGKTVSEAQVILDQLRHGDDHALARLHADPSRRSEPDRPEPHAPREHRHHDQPHPCTDAARASDARPRRGLSRTETLSRESAAGHRPGRAPHRGGAGRPARPVRPTAGDPRPPRRRDGRRDPRAARPGARRDELVVGLPLSLDGTEGPQAERTRAWAAAVAPLSGLPSRGRTSDTPARTPRRASAARRAAGPAARRQPPRCVPTAPGSTVRPRPPSPRRPWTRAAPVALGDRSASHDLDRPR